MYRQTRFLLAAAVVAALGSLPSRVFGQAFTFPQGVGAVTLAWQYVDNTGHRLSDGFLRRAGQSVTQAALFEAEYGVTDRLSASFGIPYVWAKYTGGLPPRSRLPVDACKCWHSGWQDFAVAARYRLGTDTIAFTPHVRYVFPSHDYRYRGEAVIGRNLQELQVGASAGTRLPGFLSRASVQASYTYAFVERIVDVDINRSNLFFDVGYAPTRRLYARVGANWQNTPNGLRTGSVTGRPFFLPGDYARNPAFVGTEVLGRGSTGRSAAVSRTTSVRPTSSRRSRATCGGGTRTTARCTRSARPGTSTSGNRGRSAGCQTEERSDEESLPRQARDPSLRSG